MSTATSTTERRSGVDRLILLRLLFLGVPGSIEIRALDPAGKRKPVRRWIGALKKGKAQRITEADLAAAAAEIEKLERDGLNVYLGVATRVPKGGKKSDLGFVRAAWVDLDGWADRKVEDVYAACELLGVPPPSAGVHTGGGYHLYWALRKPLCIVEGLPGGVENRDRLEAILRGLAKPLGGDKAATDASRILRPSETTNRPSPEKRAKGRTEAPVRLLFHDAGRRYSIDDLAALEEAGRRVGGSNGSASTAEVSYERPEAVHAELPERVREILESDERVRARYEGYQEGLNVDGTGDSHVAGAPARPAWPLGSGACRGTPPHARRGPPRP